MRNLAGKKFGRWNVILLDDRRRYGYHKYWYCRCDCGNEGLIYHRNLTHKISRSCGCLKAELARAFMKKLNFKHGHYSSRYRHKSPTMHSYQMMLQRCLNPKATHYADYGGRGIKVCRRWMPTKARTGKGFANFLADLGVRPRSKTLDRKDVNKGYSPTNCCWSTKKVQMANRRPYKRRSRMNREEIRRSARKFVKLCQDRQVN
jgi:hypothetical protein